MYGVVSVWRKLIGPLFCYDASSTFERKRLGPPFSVGDARTRYDGTVCLDQRFSVVWKRLCGFLWLGSGSVSLLFGCCFGALLA